jgi:hypothetical protein
MDAVSDGLVSTKLEWPSGQLTAKTACMRRRKKAWLSLNSMLSLKWTPDGGLRSRSVDVRKATSQVIRPAHLP